MLFMVDIPIYTSWDFKTKKHNWGSQSCKEDHPPQIKYETTIGIVQIGRWSKLTTLRAKERY